MTRLAFCWASKDTNTDSTSPTASGITFDTDEIDASNLHDDTGAGSANFVAPATGVYRLTIHVYYSVITASSEPQFGIQHIDTDGTTVVGGALYARASRAASTYTTEAVTLVYERTLTTGQALRGAVARVSGTGTVRVLGSAGGEYTRAIFERFS